MYYVFRGKPDVGSNPMYTGLYVICYMFRDPVQFQGKPDVDYVIRLYVYDICILCMCGGNPDVGVCPMPDAVECRGEPDAGQESDAG